jgi:hypothetical protein
MITIVGGISMTIVMNWENKLVFCTTNVGLSNYNSYFSTTSNNGFLTILNIFGAALLSSCGIDSSLTLILNMFVHKYLARVRNPCINCKDCAPISIGLYSGMRIFGHD